MIRHFLPLLAAGFVLAGGAPTQDAAPQVMGHRSVVDGIDVVHLRGTPTEQAFAEGYLCAEEIPALFRDVVLNGPLLPEEAKKQAAGLWNLMVLPTINKRVAFPEVYRERAEALLDGIAARDPDLLEIPELRRELGAEDLLAVATFPDFAGLACSSFVAWGDRVQGKGPLVGRNLDYFATDQLLQESMVFVRAPSEGRRGWVSIGWPGILGCLTGISEDGLFVSIHDVPADALEDGKVTPRPIALQELLETVEPGRNPVAAATASLREHTYGMGGNFLFAWKGHGDQRGPGGAVFEVFPAESAEAGVTPRLPEAGQAWITCSNHHRARIEPPYRCNRYFALFDGLGALEAAIDLDGAGNMIRESEVRGTLHQVVADLDAGTFSLRLRRKPRENEWSEAGPWSVAELLAEAVSGPTVESRGGR